MFDKGFIVNLSSFIINGCSWKFGGSGRLMMSWNLFKVSEYHSKGMQNERMPFL